jgi:hypothetical protein
MTGHRSGGHPDALGKDRCRLAPRASTWHSARAWVQSRFFGWPWPPGDEDLRRLSRSLGGVAFRPAMASQAAGEYRPRAAWRVREAEGMVRG